MGIPSKFRGNPVPLKASNPLALTAQAVVTNTPGSGTSSATGAIITAGNAETYDVSENNALTIYICHDGTDDAGDRVFFPILISDLGSEASDASAATAAEVAAAINAVPLAARHLTASDASGSLRLTTKYKGTKARIYVTGAGNTPLGFTQVSNATSAAGAGVASTVTFQVRDTSGNYLKRAEAVVTLYAAATGASKDATATVQHNRDGAGGITSGEFSNTATVVTNEFGNASIEIIDSGSGAQTAYMDIEVPLSGKALASRSTITTGS